jgi:hypothetical protein
LVAHGHVIRRRNPGGRIWRLAPIKDRGNIMFSAILAAVLLAQATPAAANDSAPAVAAATTTAPTSVPGVKVTAAKPLKLNKDGLVCHNQYVIGSRIPQKLCYTPAQEEERRREDQETAMQMQRPGGSNGNAITPLPTRISK